MRGEIEAPEGILRIARIRVRYRIRAPEEQRETIERVHGVHADHCPVYLSIKDAIQVSTELEIVPE